MLQIRYGTKIISFIHEVEPNLKHAYIKVDQEKTVVLKSPMIDKETACKLVQKKANWIIQKLAKVSTSKPDEISTGSRRQYLGKKYYVQILSSSSNRKPSIRFNYSKFIIHIHPNTKDKQATIQRLLDNFYRQKAKEKILPRLQKWIQITGLRPNNLIIRKMSKRWGSCSKKNNITLNLAVIQLPTAIIDYILVHELVHLKIKRHSRIFWQEVGKYIPNYRILNGWV